MDFDAETLSRLQQSADTIRKWLDKCTATHGNSPCNTSVPTRPPKRLIHLDPASGHSRLVDAPDPAPAYAALSYVWGPTTGSNARGTLRSNLAQMRRGIPADTLPLTLRHVFRLVRLLGLAHLWVDALCIVQDDPAEKAVEIGRMEFVYLNAALQVSAMASPGARHGLLPRRQLQDYPGTEMDRHHLVMKACRGLRQRDWDGRLRRDYPLLTRGWAYQERILARRIAHFTAAELLWECKAARWCECGGVEARAPGAGTTNLINNMSAAFEECVALGAAAEELVPMWRECVMGFSRGRLTVEGDRLLAISGVGRMLGGGRAGEGAYVAGMRRGAMPFELLWRCDQSAGLPLRTARRPSWSWGSVDGGVDWPSGRRGTATATAACPTEAAKSLAYVVSGTFFEEGVTGVEVVDLEVKPAGIGLSDGSSAADAGFGAVEQAKLTMAARMVPASVMLHRDRSRWHEAHGTDWCIGGREGQMVLPFYPDVEFTQEMSSSQAREGCVGSETTGGGYFFLEVATLVEASGRWEAGLVVRDPCDGASVNGLERVGMAGFHECVPLDGFGSWFDGTIIQTVTLV